MNPLFYERLQHIQSPNFHSSYRDEDCLFVLKNIGEQVRETDTEEKELRIAQGVHYSEMLSKEYVPNRDYVQLFHDALRDSAFAIAQHVANVAELIIREKGKDVILVSLARAGTPVGVLIKRYLLQAHGLNLPHYSVSIIRGKGMDENALIYLINKHPGSDFQFIDGWTGKGVITEVLKESISQFNHRYGVHLNDELAVLADPSQSTSLYATREDYLIPSACLNSTVSGLSSRTLHKSDVIGEYDFHGAKYYQEWEANDLSNFYVDQISSQFPFVSPVKLSRGQVMNTGILEVRRVQAAYGIQDINKVKPGVGETTRVLLRRIPWKILINEKHLGQIQHVLLLAKERNVAIEVFNDMHYSCMGLIQA